MEDYTSNAKRHREPKPEKKITKVVTGEVLVQKKSLGRKFVDVFIAENLTSVMRYVTMEVLLPAAKNMLYDAGSKGLERAMYGMTGQRRFGPGIGAPRITYNSPINRFSSPLRDNLDRSGLGPRALPAISPRSARADFILTTREEAEAVLEQMKMVIDQYEVVTVSDLNEMLDMETSPIDMKWGWIDLRGVEIRQVREGYLLNLPQPEPI